MRDAVVSGGDAAELFELADGPLDAVAQLVFDRIEIALARHTRSLGDDGLGAPGLDKVEDCMAIVSLVGKNVACGKASEQRDAELGIAGIAAGQDKTHRATEGIDRDVPLAGQSASGAPQSLIADPPFWPVAA